MPPQAAGNGASDPLKSALQAKAVEEGFDALRIANQVMCRRWPSD